MFTEQMSQSLAVLGTPISPSNQASSSVAYTVGPVSAANIRRFLGIIQAGVITGSGTLIGCFQACSASTGTFANISSPQTGASVTLSTSNTNGTVEIRSDQLPSGTQYIRLAVFGGTNAAFCSAVLLGGESAYKPASLYSFDTTNVNLVQNVT